jgi:hypothetical protein
MIDYNMLLNNLRFSFCYCLRRFFVNCATKVALIFNYVHPIKEVFQHILIS